MKIKIIIFVALIISLLLPTRVFAQMPIYNDLPSVLNEIQVTENRATFSLADIGVSERRLAGPFSDVTIFFSVPQNWQLTAGSSIQLQFDITISRTGENLSEDVTYASGANLIVEFNDVVIGTIAVDKSGNYTQQFLIPGEAVVSSRVDGRHALQITLDSQLSCNYDLSASATIKAGSIIDLFYQ